MKNDEVTAATTSTPERWMHGAVEESGHRGKGPKNYVRSDARIFEDVGEALSREDAVDASEITISVLGGECTLDGSVTTPRMKTITEEVVAAVPGVRQVRNRLRVKST